MSNDINNGINSGTALRYLNYIEPYVREINEQKKEIASLRKANVIRIECNSSIPKDEINFNHGRMLVGKIINISNADIECSETYDCHCDSYCGVVELKKEIASLKEQLSIQQEQHERAMILIGIEFAKEQDKGDKLKEQLKREQDTVDYYSLGDVEGDIYLLPGDDIYYEQFRIGKLARATQARREK